MRSALARVFTTCGLFALLVACGGAPAAVAPAAPEPTAAPPAPEPTGAPEPTVAPAPTEAAEPASASAEAAVPEGAVTFTDGSGTTVTLPKPAERIVCLYHSCLEYLAALGIVPLAAPEWAHLWQFAENPEYFPQPTSIIKLKMTDDGPDLEQLAQLKPDLVFGWTELKAGLEGIAPLHDVGALAQDYKSTLTELRDWSAIFGKESEADAAINRFEDRLAAYKKLSPRTLSVLNTGGDGKDFWITTGDSVPCTLLNEVAHCSWPNPKPSPGIWGYSANIEAVLALDPDVIIFESWTDTSPADMVQEMGTINPLWNELKAVKNKRVYNDLGRSSYGIATVGGTRLLDTYMPLLYPDVFPAALTDEQVQEILAQ